MLRPLPVGYYPKVVYNLFKPWTSLLCSKLNQNLLGSFYTVLSLALDLSTNH